MLSYNYNVVTVKITSYPNNRKDNQTPQHYNDNCELYDHLS